MSGIPEYLPWPLTNMIGMRIGQSLDVMATGTGRFMNEYFEYLDELREVGVTNMFGAASYLQEEFGLNKNEAKDILIKWIESK